MRSSAWWSSAKGLLLCAALVCSAGCAKQGAPQGGPTGIVRIAIPDGLIFSELITIDDKGREVPDLAQTVLTQANGGISKNGLTITYRLRPNAKWHDGARVTSRDVKFTWQAVMNRSNNVLSHLGYAEVASMDTPDDRTVVMHLKRVFPPAIDTIFGESDQPYRILPEHLLAKYPNLNSVPFNAAPVGSGPFKFARWERNDRIVLDANPALQRDALSTFERARRKAAYQKIQELLLRDVPGVFIYDQRQRYVHVPEVAKLHPQRDQRRLERLSMEKVTAYD